MQKIFDKILFLKNKFKSNIVFDTRQIKKNDIFIGIGSGEKNGGRYYREAIIKGAKLLIINTKTQDHESIIYFEDTDILISKFCKYLLQKYKGKIIAISGSVGKTTVKENIFNVLINNHYLVSKSYKNFNNLLGLQFSIMNINLHYQYSIFELGINNPGEMHQLIKILNPHYCLITCIENSHIGNFKDFNNLVDNKLQLFKSKNLIKGLINFRYERPNILKKINSKVSLINIDLFYKKVTKKKSFVIDFKFRDKIQSIQSDMDGVYEETAILTSVFLKSFIPLKKDKFLFKSSILESRGKIINKHYKMNKIKIYDHSYNASPFSLERQLEVFNQKRLSKKLCIIGSMRELGQNSSSYHKNILNLLLNLNFQKTILIGEGFFEYKKDFQSFKFYRSTRKYLSVMNNDFMSCKNVFIMGSRYYKLENIIEKIC